MKKVITAANLTSEIIATLPAQTDLETYAAANPLLHTFDLRNNEPREESVLRKNEGDKVVVILNRTKRRPVIGTIVKVNKSTVKVQFKSSSIIKPETITVSESGEVRGESSLFNRTEVVNYVEGMYEQMLEVTNYNKDIERRAQEARRKLHSKLKGLLPMVGKMSTEEAEKLLAAIS